jgi:hypothetical protein
MRRPTAVHDRHAAIRALTFSVFSGLLVVVASRDIGYGLVAFVTVFLGFGSYEILLGRQIGP